MSKQKTNKSAKKRFKLTGTGKLTFKQCGIKHLNTHMSAKHKRRLRTPESEVHESQYDRIKSMFPYAKYAR
jgi:large subunit ribosomal protein L35